MVQKINPHPAPGCPRPPWIVFSKDAILGSIPSISSEVLDLEYKIFMLCGAIHIILKLPMPGRHFQYWTFLRLLTTIFFINISNCIFRFYWCIISSILVVIQTVEQLWDKKQRQKRCSWKKWRCKMKFQIQISWIKCRNVYPY